MSDEWRPIETAPMNGKTFKAKIPGHGSDNIIAWVGGLRDDRDRDCGGWAFVEDQEPPDCWTDGICWEHNEDGKASIRPTHWAKLEQTP